MSFTDIDFAPRRAPSGWTLAGLAAALALCAAGAYRHHEAGRAAAEATAQLRKLRNAAHGRPADTGSNTSAIAVSCASAPNHGTGL